MIALKKNKNITKNKRNNLKEAYLRRRGNKKIFSDQNRASTIRI